MTAMAKNWGAAESTRGGSVMLAKVSPEWGKGWDETEQKALPGPAKPEEITTGSALLHLAGAKLLTASPTIRVPLTNIEWHIPSVAESSEKAILEVANKVDKALGVHTVLKTPDKETLQERVAEIEEGYRSLFPPRLNGMTDDADIVQRVMEEAERKTQDAFRVSIDWDVTPNETEKVVAAQLEQMVGNYPAAEIREVLWDLVHAQAADEARVHTAATFTRLCPDYNERLAELLKQRPTEFYSAPWLTTEVLLPSEMQPDVENTHWALTPGMLVARRVVVKGMKEDQRRISMGLVNAPTNNAVIINEATPPYVDVLRQRVGRWLEPVVNALAGADLGGTVVLRQLQTEHDPIYLAVPDPKAASMAINRVAGLYQGAQRLAQFVNGTVMNVDNDLRHPIRPGVVRRMLPPLATDVTMVRGRDGRVDLQWTRDYVYRGWSDNSQQLQELERRREVEKAAAVERKRIEELRRSTRVKVAVQKANGEKVDWHDQRLIEICEERLEKMSDVPRKTEVVDDKYHGPILQSRKALEESARVKGELESYMQANKCPRCGAPRLGSKCEHCGK